MVTLDEALGGIVSQKNTGEVGRALFLDQETCPERQSGVACKKLVER
jgi:hypothetical protein